MRNLVRHDGVFFGVAFIGVVISNLYLYRLV